MGRYNIWKDGKVIESGFINHSPNDIKKRLKELNGNVLHVINGEVVNVYQNRNGRVYFSHIFCRER
jgi:hypothetical protein